MARLVLVMTNSKLAVMLLGAASTLCTMSITLPASARASDVNWRAAQPPKQNPLAAQILSAHNAERARLHLPRLSWNEHLEREAHAWARVLSRKGYLRHASAALRGNTGENLWMGTAGYWNAAQMIEMFIGERRDFRRGRFPNVSRTGNWADVGHYTQIIWRDTREVGCALARGHGMDVLVCRYWPAGNVWGERAL